MTLTIQESTLLESPLFAWDARWKLAAILALMLGTVSLRSPALLLGSVAIAVILTLLGRVPLKSIVPRIGFLVLAVVPLVGFLPWADPARDQSIAGVTWSSAGLTQGIVVVLRVIAVGLLALVLTGTTPMTDLPAAAHALGIPGPIVQIAELAHRYTFTFAGEYRRIRIALRSRGFQLRTSRSSYRVLGQAVGTLLVHGHDRAERVAQAMRCRGYDGTYRTSRPFPGRAVDVLGFVVIVSIAVVLVVVDRFS